MRKTTRAVAMASVLALVSPAFAIYQEPKVPQTDNSEPLPGKSVKLDQDQPSTDQKTPPKQAKPREREVPARQAGRKPVVNEERTDRGLSPEASRALGTAISIGIGAGMMGFGRRGGDDRGMGGRMGDR